MLKLTDIRGIWLLALLITALASCRQSAPEAAKYIPKDASLVVSANPKQLQDKLAGSHISIDSVLRALLGNTPAATLTGSDLENSGIDLKQNIYVFVKQAGSMMRGTTITTGIVAVLNKASAFEDFIRKKSPAAAVQKAEDFSYVVFPNGFVTGWNNDVIIADDVTSYSPSEGSHIAGEAEALKQLTTFFNGEKEASLASLSQFQTIAGGKADMLFWTNSNSAFASIPMIGMSRASDLLKDTYTGGTLTFDKGKAEAYVTTFPNTVLADTLTKYAGAKVNTDYLTKYPGAVTGFALFSFNPELLISILDYIGVLQTANQFLQNQGFALQDVSHSFSGDFAIVFSNLRVAQQELQGVRYSAPTADLIINAGIANKATYDKVAASLADGGLMVKRGDEYIPSFLAENPGSLSMKTNDKNLVLSSNPAFLQQYMAGGNVALPAGILDEAKGSSTAFYFDLHSIFTSLPKDSTNREAIETAAETFKDFFATTNNISDGAIKGHAVLHTVKPDENSLVSLTRYMGAMSAIMEALRQKNGEAGMYDMPGEDYPPGEMDGAE